MAEAGDRPNLQTAFALHQSGQLKKASEIYRQILNQNPVHSQALHYLGVVEASVGHFEQAKGLLARSVQAEPSNVQFIENYATILCQSGDYERALDVADRSLKRFRENITLLYVSAVALFKLNKFHESLERFDKVLLLQPKHIAALNERGSVLAALEQYETALASVEKALSLDSTYADAHVNQGNLCSKLTRYAQAGAAYDKALALRSDLATAWLGHGNVFLALKRFDESVAAYDKALAVNPGLAEAWFGRGNVSYELRRYDETLTAYDKALALNPALAEALLGRGNVLHILARYKEALAAYDSAIALKPQLAEAWLGRGSSLAQLNRPDDAHAAIDRALTIDPNSAGAWLARGLAFADANRMADAHAAIDKALSIKPDFAEAISGKIFVLEFTKEAGFEEQQKARQYWWQKVGSVVAGQSRRHYSNTLDPDRRIKLGYVSGDFRRHSAALCFRPLLLNHDKARFDITCYSTLSWEDDYTEDFRRASERWRNVVQSSDDEFCAQILADQIDILIDLSGHTAGERLTVFARKPAPIQVTAGATGTGLPTIDYLLSDPVAIPQSVRHLFTEKIVDLPCIMTIRSLPEEMRPSDPPLLSKGHITFGVFNRASKNSDEAVALWARILQAVPQSQILMKHYAFDETSMRSQILERFAVHGIAAERIAFLGRTSRLDHLAAFSGVDISLDPFPQNGGISTLESLQMGVPVVAVLGNTVASRTAGALLSSVGVTDWVAESADAYLDIAVKFAAMPELLKGLRYELPTRVAASAAGEAMIYAGAVEAAYRTMWQDYCRATARQLSTV